MARANGAKRKQICIYLSALYLALLSLPVISCSQERLTVIDRTNEVGLSPLTVPEGVYGGDAAWLVPDQIILPYEPTRDLTGRSTRLLRFNPASDQWGFVPFSEPEDCEPDRYGRIGRLPDGRLGFIYECFLRPPERSEWHAQHTLYAWGERQQFETLQLFPRHVHADAFSFAPDMSELIQESGGGNLQSELYHVDRAGNVEQFLPEFYRVRAPSWSPDGTLIAFFGNKRGPFLSSIDSIVDHPWNLYLFELENNEVETILSGVQYARQLMWSPNGSWLAFDATYEDVSGIFVFDPVDSTLVLVWSKQNIFDWSPHGDAMIVIDQDLGLEHIGEGQPVTLDLTAIID